MKTLVFTAAAAVMMMATPALAAPVIGDTVTCAGTMATCSASTATVGSGVEFTGQYGTMPILGFDFSSGLLTLTNALGSAYAISGGIDFRFRDTTNAFTQATLLSNTGFIGVSQLNFTLAGGVLTFANPFGYVADKNATMTVRLGSAATLPSTSVGAVPEPASWAMMIAGVGAIGVAMRRRSKVSTAVRFA